MGTKPRTPVATKKKTIASRDREIRVLVRWAKQNLDRLLTADCEDAAAEICDELLLVDRQLGIEVIEDTSAPREAIITAFSDDRLFGVVRQITDSLADIPDWRFIPLKPPRGFDFELSMGDQTLEATALEFSPIPDLRRAIQLMVPNSIDVEPANEEEFAWLIVESGIGEELTSYIEHIEFAQPSSVNERRPISELAAYIKEQGWHRRPPSSVPELEANVDTD